MRRLAVLFSLLGLAVLPLHAGLLETEVRAADTARVRATLQADTDRLAQLLSDNLTYGHLDGRVQTKEEFITAVKTGRVKYEAYDYDEVQVSRATDDVAIMTGRARLRASAGTVHVEFALRFLSIWRREDGAWRLLAYQSTRLPETEPAKH